MFGMLRGLGFLAVQCYDAALLAREALVGKSIWEPTKEAERFYLAEIANTLATQVALLQDIRNTLYQLTSVAPVPPSSGPESAADRPTPDACCVAEPPGVGHPNPTLPESYERALLQRINEDRNTQR